MKKIILKTSVCLFLFCIVFSSKAQIEKGMKVLSGSASFYNSSSNSTSTFNKYKRTSIDGAPQMGFFISNKFCIGLSIPLNFYLQTSGISKPYSSYRAKEFQYGVAPYVRYYKSFSDKFYCFVNASTGVGFRNMDIKGNNPEVKLTGYSYSAGAGFGLLYFVSSKLSIETTLAGISYNHYSNKTSNTSGSGMSHDFSASIAPSRLSLGLSYYFK